MAQSKRDDTPPGSILVTGGCGFLGSHIVSLLLSRYGTSTRISVLDLHTSRNVYAGATYHNGDLTDANAVRNVLVQTKPDVVIHTASPVFSTVDAKGKELMYKVNVVGTQTMLDESKRAGVRAFVYTSSASIVSDTRTNLVNADERYSLVTGKLQAEYYSDTKAEAEAIVIAANDPVPRNGPAFLTCAVRPSAMFGEQDVQMIPRMLNVLRGGSTGWQLGENNNLFDFTYVGNVAHAHALAARRLLDAHAAISSNPTTTLQSLEENEERVDGEAFIITNTTPIYFWDFTHSLWWTYYGIDQANGGKEKCPSPVEPKKVKVMSDTTAILLATLMGFVYWIANLGQPRLTPAQVRYSCMTRFFLTAKAESRLGYEPVWTIEEGIKRTAQYFWDMEQDNLSKKAQ